MNTRRFVRCVDQFGLSCVEQQYQRGLRGFLCCWSVLFIMLFGCTFYLLNLGGEGWQAGQGWVILCFDSLFLAAFLMSARQRYLVRCYIHHYRKKHSSSPQLRRFQSV